MLAKSEKGKYGRAGEQGKGKMKKKILIIMMMVFLYATCTVQGYPDKDFNSSGQIGNGEMWGNVNIYGNDTVVDMIDWSHVGNLTTHDNSTFNYYGGVLESLLCIDGSIANIYGYVSMLIEDNATLNVFGGGGNLEVTGGQVYLYAYDVIFLPDEGSNGGGLVNGRSLINDEYINLELYPDTYSYITVVPEPASLILFGFGLLIVRPLSRRKRKK